MGARRSGIRWREDTGWEFRCESCARRGNTASYWPLTDEFWDPARMTMCRACLKANRNRTDRKRYGMDAALRARRMRESAAYRAENGSVIALKKRTPENQLRDRDRQRARYWTNPEAERAKSRAYYERNRAAILEKRRAMYRRVEEAA